MSDDAANPLSGALSAVSEPAAPSPVAPPDDAGLVAAVLRQFEAVETPAKPAPSEPKPEPAAAEPAKPEPAEPKPAATEFPENPENIKSPAALAKWGEMRKELMAERDRRAALEQRVAEMEAKGKDTTAETAKLAEMEAQLAEKEKYLAAYRVEQTEAFKAEVTRPLSNIRQLVDTVAKKYDVSPSALRDAMAETDDDKRAERLETLMESFKDHDRIRMFRAADDFQVVQARANEIYDKADEAEKELKLRDEVAAKEKAARSAAELKQAGSAILDQLADKLGLDDDSTTAVLEDFDQVDFGKLAPRDTAYGIVSGLVLPKVAKALATRDARIRELEATIAKYNRATPGAGAPTPVADTGGDGGFIGSVTRRMFGG